VPYGGDVVENWHLSIPGDQSLSFAFEDTGAHKESYRVRPAILQLVPETGLRGFRVIHKAVGPTHCGMLIASAAGRECGINKRRMNRLMGE
jgi:hypothetical protein